MSLLRYVPHCDPFTADNSTGYSPEEIDALNSEFTRRWNGWTVTEAQRFVYGNGVLMTEEDAIKAFQQEVADR